MKKPILLPLMLLYSIVFSQTSFGLKAGYSLSNLKSSSEIMTVDYDAKSSLYFGALVETKFNDKFALQGELLYSRLGGSASYAPYNPYPQDAPYTSKHEEEANYNILHLPLMGKYYFTNNLGAVAGINFNFILSGTYKTDVYNDDTNELLFSVESDADNTKSAFITPFLGLEYQFNNRFFIDGRYYFASDISKYEEIETKINFMQFGIGYKFK